MCIYIYIYIHTYIHTYSPRLCTQAFRSRCQSGIPELDPLRKASEGVLRSQGFRGGLNLFLHTTPAHTHTHMHTNAHNAQ